MGRVGCRWGDTLKAVAFLNGGGNDKSKVTHFLHTQQWMLRFSGEMEHRNVRDGDGNGMLSAVVPTREKQPAAERAEKDETRSDRGGT